MRKYFNIVFTLVFFLFFGFNSIAAEKTAKLISPEWSFNGFFGKFDRVSLQRGYQVYTEVCAACHSMKYLSYRNLSEPGGPEFSESQAKAIASNFEVTDGPNSEGEMFTRPAKLSDKFVILPTGVLFLFFVVGGVDHLFLLFSGLVVIFWKWVFSSGILYAVLVL